MDPAQAGDGSVCSACLVRGRSVVPLGSGALCYVFCALTDCGVDTARVTVCWECAALLRRAARFRLRVTRAHFCLQVAAAGGADYVDIKPDSSLCCVGPVAEVLIDPEGCEPACEQNADSIKEECQTDSEIKSEIDPFDSIQYTYEQEAKDCKAEKDLEASSMDARSPTPLHDTFEYEPKNTISPDGSLAITPTSQQQSSVDYTPKKRRYNQTGGKRNRKFVIVKLTEDEVTESLNRERNSSKFRAAKHKCHECAIVLNTKQSLNKHRLLHDNTNTHVCRICNMRLENKLELLAHIKKHLKRYKCPKCPFVDRNIHVIWNHECKQCFKCHATFGDENERRDHSKSCRSERTYKCRRCEETFSDRRSMIEHSSTHDVTEHACTECHFSATSVELLESHVRTQHNSTEEKEQSYAQKATKSYQCEVCGKSFWWPKFLENHIYNVHREISTKYKGRGRPNQRRLTTKLSEAEMWEYRKLEANSERFRNAEWKCEKCILTFTTEDLHMKHEKSHFRKAPYVCKICTMPMITEKLFWEHTREHYMLYSCLQCDLKSIHQNLLTNKQHYQSHDVNECEICGVQFKELKQKYAHMMEHTDKDGGRVYECDKCAKEFTTRELMKRHFSLRLKCQPQENKKKGAYDIIKLTEKEVIEELDRERNSKKFRKAFYKCNDCAIILHVNNYGQHLSLHENTNEYVCSLCSIRLQSRSLFSRHVKKHYYRYKCPKCPFTGKNLSTMHNHKCQLKFLHKKSRSERTYKCKRCEKTFSDRRSMIEHSSIHEVTEHACTECHFSADSVELLETHVRTQHNPTEATESSHNVSNSNLKANFILCEWCGKLYQRGKCMTEHIYKVHREFSTLYKGRGRPGSRCLAINLSEAEMKEYRELEASSVMFRNAEWKCEKCVQTFTTEEHYMKHANLHFRKLPHLCKICTMPIVTEKLFYEHVREHYMLYSCTQCDLKSLHRKDMRAHYKSHDVIECEICGAQFKEHKERYDHMKEHTDKNGERVYECDKCAKRFTTRELMKRHLSLRTKCQPEQKKVAYDIIKLTEREVIDGMDKQRKSIKFKKAIYKCNECAIILSANNYRYHLSLHENTNEYVCSVCSVRLQKKHFLKTHMKNHYYYYKCPKCSYTDRSVCKMRNHKCRYAIEKQEHRKSCRSDRTYNCRHCKESFSDRRSMIEHSSTHNITEHACTECHFSADSVELLEAHVRTQHNSTEAKEQSHFQKATPSYQCVICGKSFCWPKLLENHLYKFHREISTKYAGRGRPHTCCLTTKLSETEMWEYRELEANSVMFRNAEWKCEKCILTFTTEDLYKKHEKLHLQKSAVHICKICTIPMLTEKSFWEHTREHYILYSCKKCDLKSLHKNQMNAHFKSHDVIECKICGAQFKEHKESCAHMRKHTDKDGDIVYECDKCAKRFTTRQLMKRHFSLRTKCQPEEKKEKSAYNIIKITENKDQYALSTQDSTEHSCTECDFCAGSVELLETHIRTQHNPTEATQSAENISKTNLNI